MKKRSSLILLSMVFYGFVQSVYAQDIKPLKIDYSASERPQYEIQKVVPLETNDKSLVTSIGGVHVTDDYFFISTFSSESSDGVLVFDSKGKFLNKIAPLGHGPNEYSSLGFEEIGPDGKSVMIKGNGIPNIGYFGLDGKFIKKFDIDLGPYCRRFCESDGYVYIANDFYDKKFSGQMLSVYAAATGEKIRECVPAPYTGITMTFSGDPVFTEYNGIYYFKPDYASTVYELKEGNAIPVLAFDFGDKYMDQAFISKYPRNNIFDGSDKELRFLDYDFRQTDDWFYVEMWIPVEAGRGKHYAYFIDKKDHRQLLETTNNALIATGPSDTHDNMFVTMVDAYIFMEDPMFEPYRGQISLDDDSNPVAVFFTVK